MAKRTGIGAKLWAAGVDLSTDVGEIEELAVSVEPLDVTSISSSGHERLAGLVDGTLRFRSFFDPTLAHTKLSSLPTGQRLVTVAIGTALGDPAASLVTRQLDYAPERGEDGSLVFSVPHLADGTAPEWGRLLTAGARTDTAPTNGSAVDGGAATTTGWAATLHVTAFTGTSVTISLQDSADITSWAALTGGSFSAVTAAPTSQRIAGAAGATVRRYVRVVTTGTFTSVTFVVAFSRNPSR